jgi:hypothetical protein
LYVWNLKRALICSTVHQPICQCLCNLVASSAKIMHGESGCQGVTLMLSGMLDY